MKKFYYVAESLKNKGALCSPSAVYSEMKEIAWSDQESMYILCLNAKNKIISKHLISLGGLDYVFCSTRIVAKRALMDDAASVIMVHNHPSESADPSKNDLKITEKMKQALELLEIRLLDHVIISKNGYYSILGQNTKDDNEKV